MDVTDSKFRVPLIGIYPFWDAFSSEISYEAGANWINSFQRYFLLNLLSKCRIILKDDCENIYRLFFQ